MIKPALVLTVCLIALAAVGARPAAAESAADEAAYGAGAVLGTLLYAPFKTTFCVVGGITSALTFPFTDATTAEKVATGACGGTWAITPQVLKGRESVRFIGGGSKPLVSARN